MKTTQTVKILFRNLTSIEASKETKWLCCGMHSSWGDILSLLWTCKCDKSWLREYVHWIISYLSSGVSLVWLFLCFPLFQRLEGQDILSFVGSKPRPNEEDICFVIRPLLDVVNYLHGQQIVHLDIRVCEVKLDCKWVLYFICSIFFHFLVWIRVELPPGLVFSFRNWNRVLQPACMCNHFVGFFLQPANIFIAKSNLGVKLIDFGSARRIKNWKEGDMLAIVSYVAFTGELHKSESTFVITIDTRAWFI